MIPGLDQYDNLDAPPDPLAATAAERFSRWLADHEEYGEPPPLLEPKSANAAVGLGLMILTVITLWALLVMGGVD